MFNQQYVLESLRQSREDEAARFACEARLLRGLKAQKRNEPRGATTRLRLPRFVRLRPAR